MSFWGKDPEKVEKESEEESDDDEEDDEEEDEKEIQLICPYCEKDIEQPIYNGLEDDEGDIQGILSCEHCKKVLVGT